MSTKLLGNNQNKNIVLCEAKSLDAPPLDFSYKKIKDLADLRTSVEPRSGKRKPIIVEEEVKADKRQKEVSQVTLKFLFSKEETKKNEEGKTEKDEKQNPQLTEHQQQEGENQANEQKTEEKNEKNENEEKEKEKKEEAQAAAASQTQVKKGVEIIRIIPQNNISNTIASHNVPLYNNNKIPGKNSEDLKYSQKKVVKINLICSSLILSYNQIRTIDNFYNIIDSVMYDCKNLGWIDLSHNYQVNLNYNFSDFPKLRTLYLHCNYIKDMKEISKLQTCQELKSLTIHGNPIDTLPNFRIYIIGLLPQLKKIDTVLISKKERDNAYVWINSFRYNAFPEVKSAAKPPEAVAVQNEQMKGN